MFPYTPDRVSREHRLYWIAVTLIVIVTLARIAATHLTFAQTLDEPVHVAAGHEWLTKGYYHLDLKPFDRRVSYHQATVREVTAVWRRVRN